MQVVHTKQWIQMSLVEYTLDEVPNSGNIPVDAMVILGGEHFCNQNTC